nr:hypothetical protein [Candidatus Pantoea persica]
MAQQETLALDQAFGRYLCEQAAQHTMAPDALINLARCVLDWGRSPLRQRERTYEKVTVMYYCQQRNEAEWCLDHLRHFLVSWYRGTLYSSVHITHVLGLLAA